MCGPVPRLLLFLALSAGWAFLSWASLTSPRSHGFYRFFALECILALVLLNFESFRQWFGDPFSIRQLVSWFLLVGSGVLAALGLRLLHTLGRADSQERVGEPLIGFEKTTQLVTTGIYKFIRHPLYSSLLLLTWGVFFKNPSWIGGGLAAGATVLLVATAKVEEKENTRFFGPDYRTYMLNTKLFIPFLF